MLYIPFPTSDNPIVIRSNTSFEIVWLVVRPGIGGCEQSHLYLFVAFHSVDHVEELWRILIGLC